MHRYASRMQMNIIYFTFLFELKLMCQIFKIIFIETNTGKFSRSFAHIEECKIYFCFLIFKLVFIVRNFSYGNKLNLYCIHFQLN